MPNNKPETILEVKHLKQFFKLSDSKLKAVNDISFEVKKGEVFGLVGESGCGKTTTGRSIIKLYDITSGDVYFKGQRISAGTRWNEKEIKFSRLRAFNKRRELKREKQKLLFDLEIERKDTLREKLSEVSDIALSNDVENKVKAIYKDKKDKIVSRYDELFRAVSDDLKLIVDEQKSKIAEAKSDQKNCNVKFSQHEVEKVENIYRPKLDTLNEKISANPNNMNFKNELRKLKKEYHFALKVAKKSRLTTKIQMIFQDPIASLNPRMTVKEIIAEGLIIKGIKDKKLIEEKVCDVLQLVGLLPEHATRYPHEFSGGQRQRIGIARAVIMEPELIIADEPISALDVSIQAQVINLLNSLREKLGLTIIFIAHDLSVVKYFCNRIAVMYFGKIVEMADSNELFSHPLHQYTKSLLSAIPMPDPNYEKIRQRIIYVPKNYENADKPSLKEIRPNHFVYCNNEEFEILKRENK